MTGTVRMGDNYTIIRAVMAYFCIFHPPQGLKPLSNRIAGTEGKFAVVVEVGAGRGEKGACDAG